MTKKSQKDLIAKTYSDYKDAAQKLAYFVQCEPNEKAQIRAARAAVIDSVLFLHRKGADMRFSILTPDGGRSFIIRALDSFDADFFFLSATAADGRRFIFTPLDIQNVQICSQKVVGSYVDGQ